MQSLWMLVASLLFACMGVCVKLAAETHSAVEITFLPQFHFADADVRPGPPARGALATPHWRWQISRGVVGFSALFAYFYAITLLPLATAVTLNYTSAIFLAIYLALAGMRMRPACLVHWWSGWSG
jgi:drug/metabolite transporter (DMT)-like permease